MKPIELSVKEQVFLKDLLDKMIKVEDANKRGAHSTRMLNAKGAQRAQEKLLVLNSIRSKLA